MKNQIARALVQRIIMAAKDGQKFKVRTYSISWSMMRRSLMARSSSSYLRSRALQAKVRGYPCRHPICSCDVPP